MMHKRDVQTNTTTTTTSETLNAIIEELEQAYQEAFDAGEGYERALDLAYYKVQPRNDEMAAFEAKLKAKLAEE